MVKLPGCHGSTSHQGGTHLNALVKLPRWLRTTSHQEGHTPECAGVTPKVSGGLDLYHLAVHPPSIPLSVRQMSTAGLKFRKVRLDYSLFSEILNLESASEIRRGCGGRVEGPHNISWSGSGLERSQRYQVVLQRSSVSNSANSRTPFLPPACGVTPVPRVVGARGRRVSPY
jgi:hypothetical protein